MNPVGMTLPTRAFGVLDFGESDIIRFPQGLPGFEDQREFLAVQQPGAEPAVFLQSVTRPDLFFVTLPVETVAPEYDLKLLDEYRQVLLSPEAADLLALAIVCLNDGAPPTANLLGPLLIHRTARLGVQAIRDDDRYSAEHPLFAPTPTPENAPCS
jgi:flagellar assembly factor FliW